MYIKPLNDCNLFPTGDFSKKGIARNMRSEPLKVEVSTSKNVATQSLISPTYGKPTPDTHPLLNEDIAEPVDMILETRYVQSPQPKGIFVIISQCL